MHAPFVIILGISHTHMSDIEAANAPFEEAMKRFHDGTPLDISNAVLRDYSLRFPDLHRMTVPQEVIDEHLKPYLTCTCSGWDLSMSQGGCCHCVGKFVLVRHRDDPRCLYELFGLLLTWEEEMTLLHGIADHHVTRFFVNHELSSYWLYTISSRLNPLHWGGARAGTLTIDDGWIGQEVERCFWLVVFSARFGCGWERLDTFDFMVSNEDIHAGKKKPENKLTH